MHAIGTKANNMMKGAFAPTSLAMPPMPAAKLYPGAVEATPMTMTAMRPSDPPFKPLRPAVS